MIKTHSSFRHLLLLAALGVAWVAFSPIASAQSASSSGSPSKVDTKPGVLDRVQTAAILPKTVFFKGVSATTQERNSAGIRFASGDLALFTLVDVSGYSSAVQQTYQAYLLNETHLKIGDKVLPQAPTVSGSSLGIDWSSWTSAATNSCMPPQRAILNWLAPTPCRSFRMKRPPGTTVFIWVAATSRYLQQSSLRSPWGFPALDADPSYSGRRPS